MLQALALVKFLKYRVDFALVRTFLPSGSCFVFETSFRTARIAVLVRSLRSLVLFARRLTNIVGIQRMLLFFSSDALIDAEQIFIRNGLRRVEPLFEVRHIFLGFLRCLAADLHEALHVVPRTRLPHLLPFGVVLSRVHIIVVFVAVRLNLALNRC